MLDNTCLTKLSLKTRQLSDHTLLTVLWLWVWAGTDTDWRPKTRRRMRRVESDGRCRAQLSLSPAPASLGQDPGPHWHQSPEHHVTSHSSKHHHSAHYSLARWEPQAIIDTWGASSRHVRTFTFLKGLPETYIPIPAMKKSCNDTQLWASNDVIRREFFPIFSLPTGCDV